MSKPVFKHRKLSEGQKKSLKETGVWRGEKNSIPLDRLRHVTVSYHTFDGQSKTDGALIVLDKLAKNVCQIFEGLYELKFPFQSIKLLDEFGGEDYTSMLRNNSSCYNDRVIAEGARKGMVSLHAYGAAIDINPFQNPVIYRLDDREVVEPMAGENYLQRPLATDKDAIKKGYAEAIVGLMANHGFTEWGGNFTDKKDYHHFQVPRDKVMEWVS